MHGIRIKRGKRRTGNSEVALSFGSFLSGSRITSAGD